jgi:predicted RNase H-like HicB family nuclease
MTSATTKKSDPNTTTYHVQFTLEDGVWLAQIAEIPEVHTFGRTLGKAREYIIDALALWLDESVDRVRPLVHFDLPELPADTQDVLQQAVAAKVLAECVNEEAGELMTAAASALVSDAHLSIRDAADLLGISHQRVHQLLPDADRARAALAAIREQQKVAVENLNRFLATQAATRPISVEELIKRSVPAEPTLDARAAALALLGLLIVSLLSRK